MQNRFVIHVPSSARSTPGAEEELKEYVEDQTCWMDRFAWIEDHGSVAVAAIELNLENVRDRAVAELDGCELALCGGSVRFTARAAPATSDQSARLLNCCPDNGKGGEGGVPLQQIRLGSHDCGPGEGVTLQTGLEQEERGSKNSSRVAVPTFEKLFSGRNVLELGAGSAGLPTMALAALFQKNKNCMNPAPPRSIVASDVVDEVLEMLRENMALNELNVQVQAVDWNSLPKPAISATCIMFSDCIYTEQGGEALHRTICACLAIGGDVIGVLPDLREGVSSFEASMISSGYRPTEIGKKGVRQATEKTFRCAGGSINNYRIMWWAEDRGQNALRSNWKGSLTAGSTHHFLDWKGFLAAGGTHHFLVCKGFMAAGSTHHFLVWKGFMAAGSTHHFLVCKGFMAACSTHHLLDWKGFLAAGGAHHFLVWKGFLAAGESPSRTESDVYRLLSVSPCSPESDVYRLLPEIPSRPGSGVYRLLPESPSSPGSGEQN
eukprot:gene4770-34527_t